MRRLDQDVIARGVPQAVVDRLEVVQVDEQHRGIAGLAPLQGVLDALAEEAAVGQPGQRIVEGLERQLLLEGLALLQVAGVEHDSGSVAVEHAAGGHGLDRQPRPVALAEPPLGDDSFAGRAHRPVQEAVDGADVLGMGEVGQASAQELAVAGSQQALDRGARVVDLAGGVDGHDQVG